MKKTFADKVLGFFLELDMEHIQLPDKISAMNPYSESGNSEAWQVTTAFYKKFYNDNKERKLILGINPGRLGAGITGIPFTDSKRLEEICKIDPGNIKTHEPSSVFMYDMIEAFGGPGSFYAEYYIGSVSPLGFLRLNSKGRNVNYNYYDDPQLQNAVEPFIVDSIEQQLSFGIDREKVFCLGSGKNYKYLCDLNKRKNYFKEVIPLEHPRFVVQYKSKHVEKYVDKYLQFLK